MIHIHSDVTCAHLQGILMPVLPEEGHPLQLYQFYFHLEYFLP